jgi:recombination protein RecT
MAKRECIGAYATINYNDGKPPRSLVVSWEEIKQAWKQSAMHPFDDSGKLKPTVLHYKFFNDMVKKTIAAKITKPIIRTADDSNLFGQTIKAIELESETAKADADQDAAVASEPNGEVIDAEYEIADE